MRCAALLLLVVAYTTGGCADSGPLAERDVAFRTAVDEAALERGIRLTPGVELMRVDRRPHTADPFDFYGHAEHASGSDRVRFRVWRYHGRPTETTRQAADTLLDQMIDRIERAMDARRQAAK
jgi:hypothetical protein